MAKVSLLFNFRSMFSDSCFPSIQSWTRSMSKSLSRMTQYFKLTDSRCLEWKYNNGGNAGGDAELTKRLNPTRAALADFVRANVGKLIPS